MEIEWRVLTKAVSKIAVVPKLLQTIIFKIHHPNEASTIDVDIEIGGRKLAPFVTDVEGGKVVETSKRSSGTVKTPRIRLKEPLTPKKLRGERGVGERFYVDGPQSVEQASKKKVMEKLKLLKEMVLERLEWMCAMALTGKMIVEQDNLSFEVDYQIPADHKIVLTGEDMWSAETSEPLDDIQNWNDLVSDKTGHAIRVAVLGSNAAKHVRNRIPKTEWMKENYNLELGKMKWDFNAHYMGNIGGIDFFRYGSSFEEKGVTKNFIDPNKIHLVATDARISVEYGNILDLDADIVGLFFAKNWTEKDPSVLWNLVESRPLPVLWQPEAFIEATVCEG